MLRKEGETDDAFSFFLTGGSKPSPWGFSFPDQRLPVPERVILTPFQPVHGSILSSKRGKDLWGFFRDFLGTFCIKSKKITRYHGT